MKLAVPILALSWVSLWLTPDQQARRHFEAGRYRDAAKLFTDPMWKGTALYRDGQFEDAAETFGLVDTADGHFNQGNAWLFNGKYPRAIESYERALELKPDWKEAEENLAIARARATALERKGGDMGDQKLGADEIRFDKTKEGGQDTEVNAEDAANDSNMQALWLRRVSTKPADFLRTKFRYQSEFGKEEEK